MKLFRIRTSGLGVDVVQRYFLSRALVASLFSRAEPICAILEEGIVGNIHLRIF